MQRRGFTAAGTQRWFCVGCNRSATRHRLDTRRRHLRRWFVRWLLGDESLTDLATKLATTRRTLETWFAPLWDEPLLESKPVDVTGQVLIVDGVGLARRAVALVGRTLTQVVSWVFTTGESTEDWLRFSDTIMGSPWAVVVDGRAGLLAALSSSAGRRPLALPCRQAGQAAPHAGAEAQGWAGNRLLLFELRKVRTRRQRRRWLRAYRKWEHRYEQFLAEKTVSTERTRTGLL
jgi:hypothetical protein